MEKCPKACWGLKGLLNTETFCANFSWFRRHSATAIWQESKQLTEAERKLQTELKFLFIVLNCYYARH